MTLAAIPSPPQGVWYLGPIPIRAYAMCIIAGIIVAIWLTRKRYAARGGNPELVLDAAIIAVPAGIIGGRIYHVITDNQKYFCDTCNPVDAFKITNGGLGIWGAVILGGLAVAAFFRYKKLPLAPFADAVAPGVILAQGIGRLGNWFNQELYGAETTVPWALEIYYRVDENGRFSPVSGSSTGEVMATVHPTFLYELLWNVLIFALLMWADKRFKLGHGRVFALYVAGYTLGRFWIEQMRVDEATLVGGIRINTIVSAVIFIGAVLVFFLLKKGRETPDEVDPQYPPIAEVPVGADQQVAPTAGESSAGETPSSQ
ncbi:prolipoprotein diacylglyceryl transferase [Corynebacterium crudilactis]|uniref:Phosphatidylglycerol--prolipoprotein diacylglyceryl transferase n=1 Tax=Corynebacterium crudilactis TaxID=1652495 RepID=A0A172QXB8_9CORY|nr:prolipoprotein diacylglyceryl transferase [Corynebacterium crudilactis]ANE05363.1 prolipoprotein diacylglyceryl transferase [Corynebacterium crudilactis]